MSDPLCIFMPATYSSRIVYSWPLREVFIQYREASVVRMLRDQIVVSVLIHSHPSRSSEFAFLHNDLLKTKVINSATCSLNKQKFKANILNIMEILCPIRCFLASEGHSYLSAALQAPLCVIATRYKEHAMSA